MGAPSPAACSCLWSGLLLGTLLPSSRGSEEVCPSSVWISFGRSCYTLLQGPLETQSIDDAREYCKGNASGADIISVNNREENDFIQKIFHNHWHGPEYISLGMFFDTDDDVFKWYDESKVNFTNWEKEDSNEEPLNTCATMHTISGGWKKTTCEHLPLNEILCETTILYEKEYLLDEKVWTTTLVITSTIAVAVFAAFLWFLYQRRVYSGTRCTAHSSSLHVSYSDEEVLVDWISESVDIDPADLGSFCTKFKEQSLFKQATIIQCLKSCFTTLRHATRMTLLATAMSRPFWSNKKLHGHMHTPVSRIPFILGQPLEGMKEEWKRFKIRKSLLDQD